MDGVKKSVSECGKRRMNVQQMTWDDGTEWNGGILFVAINMEGIWR